MCFPNTHINANAPARADVTGMDPRLHPPLPKMNLEPRTPIGADRSIANASFSGGSILIFLRGAKYSVKHQVLPLAYQFYHEKPFKVSQV